MIGPQSPFSWVFMNCSNSTMSKESKKQRGMFPMIYTDLEILAFKAECLSHH